MHNSGTVRKRIEKAPVEIKNAPNSRLLANFLPKSGVFYNFLTRSMICAKLSISFYLYFLLLFSVGAKADIVKPTLVEISVFTEGYYQVEIRASIEAILTGINSEFTDTTQSPNSQKYDALRVLQATDLLDEFKAFHNQFMSLVKLKLDRNIVDFDSIKVEIPDVGYVKVPRISLIVLQGKIDPNVKSLNWFYPSSFADNVVRVRQIDKTGENWHWSNWQWIRNNQWSQSFSLTEVFHQQSLWSITVTYAQAGFAHIIPKGKDHILFILGIFLFSIRLKSLVWQVSMFTLAHSITLTLAITGTLTLPAFFVEPLIALSIAYIGFENIFRKQIKSSRLVLVFIFGLLHGLGFATMLSEFGLPNHSFISALISFNIGIEIGQMFILLMAYVLVGYWFNHCSWYRQKIIVPASLLIGLTGLYWCYDRLVF